MLDSPYTHDSAEIARALSSDVARGLDGEEAARRLAKHGPNVLRATPPKSAWRRWLAQFREPLVYLLLVAIVIALVAWQFEGRHGLPVDALVIALVIALNAALGYWQETKAESAVAALSRMTEVMSTVVRAGKPERVPSVALVPGDLLLLAEGDAVGADARLLSATSLRVQEASLTGESEAVLKDAATLSAPAALGDRLDMVFKGTAVAQGSGRALVTATGMATEMGSIARLLEATEQAPTPLQREVGRIGRMLGVVVVIIAVVVVGTILALSEIRSVSDVIAVLLLGVSLAVAAVPEGLPAILSVVLALGVQRMARRNAIVKKLSSVETLGSASVICCDKTGTLTRSEMMIERVMTASGHTRVTGAGYVPEGRVEYEGLTLAPGALLAEQIVVLSGGSLAGNAYLQEKTGGAWEIQGDPTEAAFLVAERKLGTSQRRQRRFQRFAEVPFSSDRKLMSTIERDQEHGGAFVVITKGAPEVLLERCSRVRVGAEVVPLDTAQRGRAVGDVRQLLDEALRTLSVAYRPLDPGEDPASGEALERDLIFVGTVGMLDPPRLEVAPAIVAARRAGIRVLMITGDHPRTASRIAADLGIIEPGGAALTGAELDALDPPGLTEALRHTAVYARVAPVHKLRIVEALQANGEVVAMTGDGVNDAPALKAADIGIAMGITGTEVSKQAAKMILADDNFASIVAAVREGRDIFDDIQKFLRYLLSSNLGEVLTVFLGVVFSGPLGLRQAEHELVLPLLATQILWINLVTDSAPALAMGIDPETDDVMARSPRRPGERAIDTRMWLGVFSTGLVMALVTLLSMHFYLPGGWLVSSEPLATGRTVGFTVLVLAQLFNCFNARSEASSAFRGIFRNHWLWGAVGLSLLLQVTVVQIGVFNLAFDTVPLSASQWGVCIAMSSVVLWFSELRKWIFRRRA